VEQDALPVVGAEGKGPLLTGRHDGDVDQVADGDAARRVGRAHEREAVATEARRFAEDAERVRAGLQPSPGQVVQVRGTRNDDVTVRVDQLVVEPGRVAARERVHI